MASVSPGESSRHRGNHHLHHHDYQSSGDEANDDGEDDYIAAAEAAIAALGSRVDSRCRSFRDCKPLLIHNSSGTATREFRRAPVQVRLIAGPFQANNVALFWSKKLIIWLIEKKKCKIAITTLIFSHYPHQSPLDEPVVLTDEVIFPLTVSLDKLPVSTLKVKVSLSVLGVFSLLFGSSLSTLKEFGKCWTCSLSGHGHGVEEGGRESRGAGTGLPQCPAAARTNTHFQT